MRILTVVALFLLLRSPAKSKDLEIFFIDVEGGQSTLIVTPRGQTLLVDAGSGGRWGTRDPDRILAVAKEAQVDHLDYFIATHFHPDHVGGLPEVARRLPIQTFVDYGSPLGQDRMATGSFRNYGPAREQHMHLEPKPGDHLPLDGVALEFVSAAGKVLSAPLANAGQPNESCATLEDQPEDGTENYRSVGFRLRLGAFRFLDLGDLSGNTLGELACPINLVGRVSVYLVAHHGDYDSDIPAVLSALRPRAAVMNNGATKGGDPASFKTLQAQPHLDLWQLHESKNPRSQNAPDDFVANTDDGATSFWIKLTARSDGSFELQNSRTGFVKEYPRIARGF
jgi:competence protein ComEC